MTWRDGVCQTSNRVAIADLNLYVAEAECTNQSAIDNYYESVEDLLVMIGPDYFTHHSANITGLLFIGLISATENYFRDVMGFILQICPISRHESSDEKVQLGSVLWGPHSMHGRSAFEFMAFSSAENITKTIKKFVGYQVKQNGNWQMMLGEYDKLCEIRHGIVHSGHVLSGKNALRLGLKPTRKQIRVNPSYALLQEAGVVCTTLVQAANKELFEAMVERWADSWRIQPSWDRTQADALLKKIIVGFLSKKDKKRKVIASPMNFGTMKAEIEAEYNL